MTQTGDATTPNPVQTEFHRIYNEWINEANELAQQYPITAAVVVVSGTFFGFFTLLSLSLSAMISGAFFLAIAATTAIAIQRNWEAYWNCLKPSIGQVKDYLLSRNAAPAPSTPSTSGTSSSEAKN